jgi:hypothetical protein
VGIGIDTNNWYHFVKQGELLHFQYAVRGVRTIFSYDRDRHRWWSLKHLDGSIVFQTSTGSTWTAQQSFVQPSWLDKVKIELQAGTDVSWPDWPARKVWVIYVGIIITAAPRSHPKAIGPYLARIWPQSGDKDIGPPTDVELLAGAVTPIQGTRDIAAHPSYCESTDCHCDPLGRIGDTAGNYSSTSTITQFVLPCEILQ